MQEYETAEKQLMETLAESDGNDGVVIYVENPKAKKALPPNRNVRADKELLSGWKSCTGKKISR